MNVIHTIEHYAHNGHILRFDNVEGLYPINRYQSLLMATDAHAELLDYARVQGKLLADIRVSEICCGGAPAGIMLKDAGCGYVAVSDINPLALEMCQHNAAINGLHLDDIAIRDMLGAPIPPESRFDMIVCNPPCGRTPTLAGEHSVHIRTAIDGGSEGIDPVLALLHAVRAYLLPEGRLVFVLTSMMNFRAVVQALNDSFPGAWRMAYHSPIAQPYMPLSHEQAQELLQMREQRGMFIWVGEDGWLWRLTWIVVAMNLSSPAQTNPGKLWFMPFGYDVPSPSFWENLPIEAQEPYGS
jgi:methylase of polypeptide subunit release factors